MPSILSLLLLSPPPGYRANHRQMSPPRYPHCRCCAARCHCPTATLPATTALPPPPSPRCHRASRRDAAADDTALPPCCHGAATKMPSWPPQPHCHGAIAVATLLPPLCNCCRPAVVLLLQPPRCHRRCRVVTIATVTVPVLPSPTCCCAAAPTSAAAVVNNLPWCCQVGQSFRWSVGWLVG